MKSLFYYLSLTCLIAEPASALTLSLPDVAARVCSHHPSLKAARMAVQEARGRQLAAGRLANPTLSYEFQNQSKVSPQTGVFSLDQTFPFTQRLALEKQLSTQLVRAAELEVKEEERRLVAEASSLAVRLMTLGQQQLLRQQQLELAQSLAAFTQDRAKAGEVSQLDAKQVQLDSQKLRVESRQLAAESVALLGQLKPMLGLGVADSLQLSGALPELRMPRASSWQQRPDYQLSQTKTATTQTEAELAKAKRRPDLTAGLFASHEMQDTSPGQRQRTGFVGLKLSVPLPFWNKNQGEIAEKLAAAERARLESESLASHIESEADTAWKEMENSASIVHDTQDALLPLAKQQANALQKAYESGQADLLSVLRARDQQLQLEATTLNTERDFHLARIRYEAAVGAVK